jgi:hypothetical protein
MEDKLHSAIEALNFYAYNGIETTTEDEGKIARDTLDEILTIKQIKLNDGYKKIDGWLTEKEANFLFTLVGMAPAEGVAVEIGAYMGRSSVVIGSARKVFCVDDFFTGGENIGVQNEDFLDKWKRNVGDLHCFPLVGSSTEIADKLSFRVAFLYIDGSHDYESVKADIDAWSKRLINGAIVAFHDIGRASVLKAVNEWVVASNGNIKELDQLESIMAFKVKGQDA